MPELRLYKNHRLALRGTGFVLYEEGKCETCGGLVQEVNAITFHDRRSAVMLYDLGVPTRDHEPAEIYYNEALGQTSCDECDELATRAGAELEAYQEYNVMDDDGKWVTIQMKGE